MNDPDVVATNSGYQCRYTPTVADGPVFRWTRRGYTDFEVSASRDGVVLNGYSAPLGRSALSDLSNVIALAGIAADYLAADDRCVDAVKRVLVEHEQEGETPT